MTPEEFARKYHECVAEAYSEEQVDGYEVWTWAEVPQGARRNLIRGAELFLEVNNE